MDYWFDNDSDEYIERVVREVRGTSLKADRNRHLWRVFCIYIGLGGGYSCADILFLLEWVLRLQAIINNKNKL